MPKTDTQSVGADDAHEVMSEDVPSTLTLILSFLAVFLPIVLLSVYAYQLASASVSQVIRSENLSATDSVAQYLSQETRQTQSLLQAFSSLPGTIDAISARDRFTTTTRLKALITSYPQIERATVVDAFGGFIATYPRSESGEAAPLVPTDLFVNASERHYPILSGVYALSGEGKHVMLYAKAVIDPLSNEHLGVIMFQVPASIIHEWISTIELSHEGQLLVLDDRGTVVAHPDLSPSGSLEERYEGLQTIADALSGRTFTAEYEDPVAGEDMLATFLPVAVGRSQWLVVAQRPTRLAYAELDRVKWNLSLAGGGLTALTFVIVLMIARLSARIIHLTTNLQQKNRTLRDITSIVSHQLKAPITGIKWMIESLLDGDSGEIADPVKEELQKIDDVNSSSFRLISDILNVSKLDRGVIDVDLQPTQLRDIAEHAVRDYRVPIEQAGLTLTLENTDQDILVMAEQEKLAEAVSNAISNSIKYVEKGGITVRIGVDGSMGLIEVEDTGAGMDEETLNKLFSRDQVKHKGADVTESCGLGLFIAKSFTELMGGEINVRSEVGKGTVFAYRVPLVKEEKE